MSGYALGVDGGGTKTHCALSDMSGRIVDLSEWGPTNFEGLEGGYKGLFKELNAMFGAVLSKNGVGYDEIARSVLGLAGVDSISRHAKISDVIIRTGLRRFTLVNDAFLGVKAGAVSGAGVCAINGTGTSFAGIDPAGGMLHVGGMGRLTGDIGGGWHLGEEAVGAVYNSLYKNGEPTVMKAMLFDILGVSRKEDYMDVLLEKLSDGHLNLSELNRVVFKAANLNDAPAIKILEDMGADNARSVNAVIDGLDFGHTVEVVLAGSIHVRGENPAAVDKLADIVTAAHPDKHIAFTRLAAPPVAGAAVWALEQCGVKDMFGAVTAQFMA